MADDKEKPAHVQVAEAGFGAAMIGLGFQRVSRTQWKRPGDGVTWRIALSKASKYWPDFISASYGLEVHAFDELAAKIWTHKPSERLEGTSARVHTGGSIEMDVKNELVRAHDQKFPRRTGFGGWLADRLNGPQPEFDRNKLDVRFLEAMGDDAASWGIGWTFGDGDPADLASDLALHFERLSLPKINAMLDVQSYYDKWWGPDGYERKSDRDWNRYAIAKMVGDKGVIDWMAGELFQDAMKSYDEHLSELKADDKANRRKRDPEKSYTVEEAAMVSTLGAIAWCVRLMDVARILEFEVDDPGVRFDLLERGKNEFGTYGRPSVDQVKELRRAGDDWISRYR